MTAHPFLKQIDHVGLASADTPRLLQFFASDLGLPEVPAPYPDALGGRVSLGNLMLDLVQWGAPALTIQLVKDPADGRLGHWTLEGILEE